MSTLNQNIDNAAKFQPDSNHNAPVTDQASNAQFAIDMAARMAARQTAAPPAPSAPLGAMPIPN